MVSAREPGHEWEARLTDGADVLGEQRAGQERHPRTLADVGRENSSRTTRTVGSDSAPVRKDRGRSRRGGTGTPALDPRSSARERVMERLLSLLTFSLANPEPDTSAAGPQFNAASERSNAVEIFS